MITGEEAEIFDEYVKSKDGTGYGFAFHPQDFSKLMWIVIANAVGWFGVFGFKVYDKMTGKADQQLRDLREMKEAILRLESNSRHWVTDKDVDHKVKETIRFLRESKGMF